MRKRKKGEGGVAKTRENGGPTILSTPRTSRYIPSASYVTATFDHLLPARTGFLKHLSVSGLPLDAGAMTIGWRRCLKRIV